MYKKIWCLIIIVTLVHSAVNACDMSAMIAKNGYSLSALRRSDNNSNFSRYNDPYDYFGFVMSRSNSTQQNDGYGVLYYPQNQYLLTAQNYWYKYVTSSTELSRIYYTGNYFNPSNYPDILDEALSVIMSDYGDAAIMMSHARNASFNPFAPGNHPFRMNANGRTYAIMHNGFLSTTTRYFMINQINQMSPTWFTGRSPNYSDFTNSSNPIYWIDSEVMFHYFMCHIQMYDSNVLLGIKVALGKLESSLKLSANVANFVFSDGQRLYVFRSSPLTGTNSIYHLSYRLVGNSFYGVRTGMPLAGDIVQNPFEMIVFSRDKKPARYPDFIRDGLTEGDGYDYEPSFSYRGNLDTTVNVNPRHIKISFKLEQTTCIKLKVYNQKGQFVKLLADCNYSKGEHEVIWNGSDIRGLTVSRGAYFLEMQAGSKRSVSKVLLLGK